MSERCVHRHPDGAFCKRWAVQGRRFCSRHLPQENSPAAAETVARLGSLEAMFNVVYEIIKATSAGAISPGRAYALGYLVDVWLRVRSQALASHRQAPYQTQVPAELPEDETQELGQPVRPAVAD